MDDTTAERAPRDRDTPERADNRCIQRWEARGREIGANTTHKSGLRGGARREPTRKRQSGEGPGAEARGAFDGCTTWQLSNIGGPSRNSRDQREPQDKFKQKCVEATPYKGSSLFHLKHPLPREPPCSGRPELAHNARGVPALRAAWRGGRVPRPKPRCSWARNDSSYSLTPAARTPRAGGRMRATLSLRSPGPPYYARRPANPVPGAARGSLRVRHAPTRLSRPAGAMWFHPRGALAGGPSIRKSELARAGTLRELLWSWQIKELLRGRAGTMQRMMGTPSREPMIAAMSFAGSSRRCLRRPGMGAAAAVPR